MKRFAVVFVALTGCALPTTAVKAPQISVQHPVCITENIPLDGKVQAIQNADQDLFTIQGKLDDQAVRLTVCYKGRQ